MKWGWKFGTHKQYEIQEFNMAKTLKGIER